MTTIETALAQVRTLVACPVPDCTGTLPAGVDAWDCGRHVAALPRRRAWFACWTCDCTDIEQDRTAIPPACPVHDAPLYALPEPLDDPGPRGYGVLDRNNEPVTS